jgi:hypothetical protein
MSGIDRNLVKLNDPGNRGQAVAAAPGDPQDYSVTLITIDSAIIEHLTDRIKPTVERDGILYPVPVIYGDPEKWKSVQQDGVYRDAKGRVQTPLIMIHRTGMKRDEIRDTPANKYISQTFQAGWNKRNAYDKFSALTGANHSQEQFSVVIPDYMEITYEIIAWTEFIAQLNTIIEQINFEDNEFWGSPTGHRFKVRIAEYVETTESPSTEDRIVKSTFSMNVQAYLLPERMLKGNGSVPTTGKSFTTKKVVVFGETVNE